MGNSVASQACATEPSVQSSWEELTPGRYTLACTGGCFFVVLCWLAMGLLVTWLAS